MRGNHPSFRALAHAALGVLMLLVVAACVSPASAADPPAPGEVRVQSTRIDPPGAASLPIAADRFGWLWTFLENTLHSRARMLQFGIIGMCIALYFMFRARG